MINASFFGAVDRQLTEQNNQPSTMRRRTQGKHHAECRWNNYSF
jgi:hypothetical protein